MHLTQENPKNLQMNIPSSVPILQVDNLSVCFTQGGNVHKAVKGLSFNLHKGKTLAIVGESGSGKSVSALSILRLLPEAHVSHPTGKILFENQDLLQASKSHIRSVRGNRISMIFQEPMTSLNPLHCIEKQISEVLLLHRGLTGSEARARCLELLHLVGIPQPESRLMSYPHQLSGGQKQRVMIAMALANEPDILIADEPTTALDVTVQKQVLELLKDLQSKLSMAILLITHDLNIVKNYANEVIVMCAGDQIEAGPCSKIFSHPKETYTQQLLAAEPSGSVAPLDVNAETLLKATDVCVDFITQKSLFGKTKAVFSAAKNISIELRRGETLGIVGESGSGKTTFALALLKLVTGRGRVDFKNARIDNLNQKQFRPYRKDIQVVFQDPFGSLSPRMSVAQIIAEGLEIHGIGDAESREQAVIQALIDVDLDPETRNRYPHEFSGGQRQRISVARALVLKPEVIVLDEPTSALDRTVQCQVVDLLRNLQQRYGLSYIFISHDLSVVRALSHTLLVMKDGEVIEQGPAHKLFQQPEKPYTKSLLEAAFYYSHSTSEAG
jgi:microcin C transport system ATP-binding protein